MVIVLGTKTITFSGRNRFQQQYDVSSFNVLNKFFKRTNLFYFRPYYKQFTDSMVIKSCRWLESNPGPLVSEGTALQTAPQPLPCA